MIMIIAINYISFLSYVILDQRLKITFRKSSAPPPPEKIHSLPKNSKNASPPFLPTLKPFQPPPPPLCNTHCRKVGGGQCDYLATLKQVSAMKILKKQTTLRVEAWPQLLIKRYTIGAMKVYRKTAMFQPFSGTAVGFRNTPSEGCFPRNFAKLSNKQLAEAYLEPS